MNVYASDKQNFIKYDSVKQLFKELYNVCLIFKDNSNYYCYCRNLCNQTIKCGICKFEDAFDDKSYEKCLITYRHNEEKLQQVVDVYWNFIQKIKKEDQSALDFFNKEYVCSKI